MGFAWHFAPVKAGLQRQMSRFGSFQGVPWGLACAVLVIGVIWRDCVLVGAGALMALPAFRHHMDARAPWEGWRAALRCLLMGLGSLVCAAVLVLMVAAARFSWVEPAQDRPVATLLVVLVAVALCAAALRGVPSDARELVLLWAIPVGVGIAILTNGLGWTQAPYAFALVASAIMATTGWSLARHTARELLVAQRRD